MPTDWKAELGNEKIPQRTWLRMPAIGMEAEFNVWLDEIEINPEAYWRHPRAFIDRPLLTRTKKSSQLPTGGAVYFDRGVIEVVTPLIEIDAGSTARVVRSLWEQIAFVRSELDRWGKANGHHVRLRAYSAHYNISYEIPKREQSRKRNIQTLALLLAYLLPVPVMVAGCNRRSTGVGVRPRGNRIEVTVDFTPDPGLMIAVATLIVGIVRDVMSWSSYDLSALDRFGIPTIAGVVPGKHTTRKGWLTKDIHYPHSPYTSDIDAVIWKTASGPMMSLRQIARRVAWPFRRAIRRSSDPFSTRLLFAVLGGRAPSLLELEDRPLAYDDVGRLCRWGDVILDLRTHHSTLQSIRYSVWNGGTIEGHIAARERERSRSLAADSERPHRGSSAELRERDSKATQKPLFLSSGDPMSAALMPHAATGAPRRTASRTDVGRPPRSRRGGERPGRLLKGGDNYIDRRTSPPKKVAEDRRKGERRTRSANVPFPDRRLTRSAYERVFLLLVSGSRLKIGRDTWTPVGMKGWYHAIFRRDSDGKERLFTIDQLLRKIDNWKE